MGIPEIGVLEVEEGADPLPALIEHLSMLRPALVLTGTVSERGESSGYLPYAVAKALDYAIIANVVALTIGEEVEVLQVLPRGQRRRIRAGYPLVATIDKTAPPPRAFAYGKARRGQVRSMPAESCEDRARAQWEEQPARQRAKWVRTVSGSAADRVRLLSEAPTGKGKLLVDPCPEDAAREILDFIILAGVFRIGP
jgi:electron transfer flavoprotein beta subunit